MTFRNLTLILVLATAWTPALADMVLRQSTASQAVMIGPFVDSTDGNTEETALTIANTDVKLSKNGATGVSKNSGGCTHDSTFTSYYVCTFDATDTSTVGRLQVSVHKSGALPVYHEFQVAEEAVFDACCASGAAPQSFPTNFASMSITAGGAVTAGTVSDKTGYSLSGTQTFNNTGTWTGNLSGSVGSVTGNVGGTVNGLTSTAQGNVRTALGMSSANLDTQLGTINTAVGTTIPAAVAVIDGIVDQLLIGVNVEQMNGHDVCGTGDAGTPWTGCP
jgi:hypothetical protein